MKRMTFGVATLAVFALALGAQAADQTYRDGDTDNTWTTSTSVMNWDAGTYWTDSNNAIFGGTAETVTLGSAISGGTATFNTADYVIDTAGYNLTLTGGTSGSASTIKLASGAKLTSANGITINSSIELGTGGGVLAGGAGDYGTFSGKITGGTAGTSSLTINGGHTLLNNTANDFLGNIEITSAHYLKTTVSEVIPDSAIIKLTNGSSGYKLQPTSSGSYTETFGGLTGTGYQVWVESSPGLSVTGTFKIGSGDVSSQFDGKLTTYNGGTSATLAIEKIGTGTLTLAGSNDYNGGTTVTAGTLQIGTGTGTGGVLPGNATVGASGTLKFNYGGFGVVYGGQLSGSGAVIVTGSNDLQLSGNNSGFTGTLTVDGSGAQLRIRNDNAVSGAALVLTNGGAVSVYSYVDNHNLTVGSLASSDATTWVRLGADNRGLIVGSNNQSTTFAGVIKNDAGGTGFLTKTGTGTLTLTNANTYSGATTISAGTLVAKNSSAFGTTGTVTLNDANTSSNNTSLMIDITSGSIDISRPITIANQGSGTATLGCTSTGGSNTGKYSGAITLDTSVTLDGSYTGDRFDFTGDISGAGGVTISGSSRILFSGNAKTYSGATTINNGAILQLSDGSGVTTSLIPDASVVIANGTLNIAKGNNNETVGGISGSGTIQTQPGVTSTTTLTVNNSTDQTFSGTLGNGGGSLVIVKTGAGTQTLSGANTYTGGTMVNEGKLIISNGQSWDSGNARGGNLTIASGATVDATGVFVLGGNATTSTLTVNGTLNASAGQYFKTVNMTGGAINIGVSGSDRFRPVASGTTITTSASATTSTISKSSGTYGITLDVGAVTFNVADGDADSDLTVSAPIDGSNGVTKSGAGTLNLAGANTYTGATSVNVGTLRLDGSLTSAVTVASEARLQGNGSISKSGTALTVNGTLAPGNSIGTLTVTGNVTLSGTSDFEIEQNGTTADLLSVSGTLTFGGTLNVTSLGSGDYAKDQTFNLFDFGNRDGATVFSTVKLPSLDSQPGFSWDTSKLYTDGTITVIPEPGTVGVVAAFIAAALLRKRRMG